MNSCRESCILMDSQTWRSEGSCHLLKLSRLFVYRTIKHFKDTGTVAPQKKLGEKTQCADALAIKAVNERIRRNPARSARKMAHEMKMNHTSMQNILKRYFGYGAFEKQRLHGLTRKNITSRVARLCALLKTHADHNIIFIVE